MSVHSIPTVVLAMITCAYWGCVAAKVLRVSTGAGGVGRILVPERPLERLLWLAWVPAVVLWVVLPALAALRPAGTVSSPVLPGPWMEHAAWQAGRWVACGVAALCLLGSVRCWRFMGARWRMAVDPRQRSELLVEGPFRFVRHPIYALGLLLMTCTVIILPSGAMLGAAALYASLVLLKVREEERFLTETYGAQYVRYQHATGRFVPRPAVLLGALRRSAAEPNATTGPPAAAPASGPRQVGEARRLSPFQLTMLHWEKLHPYNAAHVVRLRGPVRPAALEAAVEHVCSAAGLGNWRADPEQGVYAYLPGVERPPRVECLPAGELPALCDILTQQLNQRFPADPHHPLRWAAMNDPAGETHYIVAVYRHVAADASAIELLLAEVLRRYAGAPASARALTWRGFDYHALAGATRHGRAVVLGALRTSALYFRMRFAHKMPDDRTGDDQTRVLLRAVDPQLLARLSAASRAMGVGLNDGFLGALASAIAEITPDRLVSRHRRALSLATALDGRSLASGADLSRWFGNCVGDMLVFIPRPDTDVRDVVLQAAAHTRRQKRRRHAALAISGARLFFVRRVWPLLGVAHHRRNYRKVFPVCAGVSTFPVRGAGFTGPASDVLEYWRACPPGPAMPIVLAPTILRDRLTLGLVYRPSCLNPSQAERLFDILLSRLEQLAALSSGHSAADVPLPAPTTGVAAAGR